jgi:hypothetical protein
MLDLIDQNNFKLISKELSTKFKESTDVLCYSNSINIDVDEYKNMFLKENRSIDYLSYRILYSYDIMWDNCFDVWYNKFKFLMSMNLHKVNKLLFNTFEDRINVLFAKVRFDRDDIALLQYKALCKAKKDLGKSLISSKKFIIKKSSILKNNKAYDIIKTFIPLLFNNFDEFIINSILVYGSSKKIADIIYFISVNDKIDLNPIQNKIMLSLNDKKYNGSCDYFILKMITIEGVLNAIQVAYFPLTKLNLLKIFNRLSFIEMELDKFNYFKRILQIDLSLKNDLIAAYINALNDAYFTHKLAVAAKLKKLINNVQEVSERDVFVQIATHSQKNVKYFIDIFPEFKELSMFS